MAVTLKHATEAVGPDAGNGEIRKAQWNEDHELTGTPNRLLGFDSEGDAVETRRVTGLLETAVEVAATPNGTTTIDLSLGNFFYVDLSDESTTLEVSNPPAPGQMQAFVLRLKNPGANTLIWWSGINWPMGLVPTLSEVGTDLLGFLAMGDNFAVGGGPSYDGFVISYDLRLAG